MRYQVFEIQEVVRYVRFVHELEAADEADAIRRAQDGETEPVEVYASDPDYGVSGYAVRKIEPIDERQAWAEADDQLQKAIIRRECDT